MDYGGEMIQFYKISNFWANHSVLTLKKTKNEALILPIDALRAVFYFSSSRIRGALSLFSHHISENMFVKCPFSTRKALVYFSKVTLQDAQTTFQEMLKGERTGKALA